MMDQSPVSSTFPAVSVLCAPPISPPYDFHHRLALYLAIIFILIAPLHRKLSVAAGTFVILYTGSASIHSWALALLSSSQTRTSTLDVYPVNILLQICIFALAVLLYIRSDLGRYFSKWLAFLGFQIWIYFSYLASNYARYFKFEGSMEKSELLAKDVPCQALTNSTDMTGLFAAGTNVACHNPCAAENGSRLLPILWGSVNTETMTFRSRATINDADPFWPIVFGVLAIVMSATLIANLESNIRATRTVVYNFILAGRATWIRKQVARSVAAAWFVWSLFCLGALALAFPTIIYTGERQLASFPVARACAMMQWGPWVLAMAIAVAVSSLVARRTAGSDTDAEETPAVQTKSSLQDSKDRLVGNVKEFGNWWSDVNEKSPFVDVSATDEEAPLLTEDEMADVMTEKTSAEKF